MKVPIEVLGHKGNIVAIWPKLADGVWWKEDVFEIRLDFGGEEFGSTIGFGVYISKATVLSYSASGLKKKIIELAELEATNIMSRYAQGKRIRKAEENRKEEMEAIVAVLEAGLGNE